MNLFKHLDWRRQLPPPKQNPPVRSRTWKAEGLPALQRRLRALADNDNLVPLLLQLLDEFGADDISAGLQANLSDGEAHRFRGRLGMCMELRATIEEEWVKSRQQEEKS